VRVIEVLTQRRKVQVIKLFADAKQSDPAAKRSRAYRAVMDDELDAPNCSECLTRLEVAGTETHPHWWCPSCKVARLS